MISIKDILEAEKRQANNSHTLTVYVDARMRDPGLGRSWRAVLEMGVARERRRVFGTLPEQLPAFEAAVKRMYAALPDDSEVHTSAGWVGFFRADRTMGTRELATVVRSQVVWSNRAQILQLYRVLEHQADVLVVLADRQHVRITRVANGIQTPIEDLWADKRSATGYHMGDVPRVGFHGGVRGATAADEATRVRNEATRKTLHAAVVRIEQLVAADTWTVVGGALEASNDLIELLPQRIRNRTLLDTTLATRATAVEMGEAASRAADLLRLTRAGEMIGNILGQKCSSGRVAVGLAHSLSALGNRSVRRLFVSSAFAEKNPQLAEDLVRAALAQGAAFETVDGEHAVLLDKEALGIAAQLRFKPAMELAVV